ncbi:MAG: zinc-dependent alcohol dehydrogenase [Chloroflexota bacterium]
MRPDHRVVFTGQGVVEIEEGASRAPGPGEVLLETQRSLISTGTELAHLLGPAWTNPGGRTLPTYPHYTGYSNMGRVVAVGQGVTAWKEGDRVASGARHGAYPLLREGMWTVRIPDGVSDEAATFCTLGTTVLNGCRIGEPQLGEDAVVVGMGLLGQLLVQYLRIAGCERVIGIDLSDGRLEIAGEVGAATHCLNPSKDDVVAAVIDLTSGRGADVVYEATGLTKTFNLALDLVRFYGRVVALGSPRWAAPVDMMQVHMKAVRVLGAIVSSHPPEDDRRNRWSRQANGEQVVRWLADGRLKVGPMITDRVPAEDAVRAFTMLAEQREQHLGVILEWL